MRTLAILGGGGHGQDLAQIVQRHGDYEFVGFYDDDPDVKDRLGPIAYLDHGRHRYLIGVNDPHIRAGIAQRACRGFPAVIIDPSTGDLPTLLPYPGVVIGAFTQIGPRVRLGSHTHIGPGVTITRTTVGAYCTISPGATICGDVRIGDRTLIGAGAVIKNLITIGNDVVVGAGAVVVDDVPDGATVVGVPARSR